MKQWLNTSIPRNKMLLGLSIFGRSFLLDGDPCNGVHTPIKSVGIKNVETYEAGYHCKTFLPLWFLFD